VVKKSGGAAIFFRGGAQTQTTHLSPYGLVADLGEEAKDNLVEKFANNLV